MSQNLYEAVFQSDPAVLKSMDGRLLETGTLQVSAEEKYVEFISDFVPLFKMGTQLKIVRLCDDIEVQEYVGEVYLSSQDMLRLISVHETILPGARLVFLFETELEGTIHAELSDVQTSGVFHKKLFSKKDVGFPVTIHAISMQHLKFTTDKPLEKGQKLILDLEQPSVSGAELEIDQIIDFGQEKTNCYCRIVNLNTASHQSLDAYVEALSQANRVFDNEVSHPDF